MWFFFILIFIPLVFNRFNIVHRHNSKKIMMFPPCDFLTRKMFCLLSISTPWLLWMALLLLPSALLSLNLYYSFSPLVSLFLRLLFLLTEYLLSLGCCIKTGLKCTKLVNAFFPCLQTYQSAYNILCISALLLIVAEYSLVVFQGYISTSLQSRHYIFLY